MNKKYLPALILSFLLGSTVSLTPTVIAKPPSHKIVIAHRGASGYLPEHSLEAKAMAYTMNADYIEQDVVMTKDNQLVVLHDHYLDRVTDVMDVFPKRFRLVMGKKRWFAIDFTLKEIKSLRMSEGFTVDAQTHKKKAIFPERFPLFKSTFKVSTLQQEIELIQGLNKSTGKNIGLYVEIKAPWFHKLEGRDISKLTLQVLKKYGYQSRQDKIFIQCFDPEETQRIHNKLLPELHINLKLVQLIAMTDWYEKVSFVNGKPIPYNYDWMLKPGAMKKIARYADGIGPWKPMLVSEQSTPDHLIFTPLLKEAHEAGLLVHPYTFRKDKGRIPPYAKNFNHLLDIFLYQLGVDGIFTDYPDLAVAFIKEKEKVLSNNNGDHH